MEKAHGRVQIGPHEKSPVGRYLTSPLRKAFYKVAQVAIVKAKILCSGNTGFASKVDDKVQKYHGASLLSSSSHFSYSVFLVPEK